MDQQRFTTFKGEVTVEIDGKQFVGKPLTLDLAEPLFAMANQDGRKLTRLLTAATFGIDEAMLGAMPWSIYSKLAALQTEINGLRPVQESAEGEAQAAASTSA